MVPGVWPLGSWNFLSTGVSFLFIVVYASKGAHCRSLDSSWQQDDSGWGLLMAERPALWLEQWGFEPCDISLMDAERWRPRDKFKSLINDAIKHAYIIKSPSNHNSEHWSLVNLAAWQSFAYGHHWYALMVAHHESTERGP